MLRYSASSHVNFKSISRQGALKLLQICLMIAGPCKSASMSVSPWCIIKKSALPPVLSHEETRAVRFPGFNW